MFRKVFYKIILYAIVSRNKLISCDYTMGKSLQVMEENQFIQPCRHQLYHYSLRSSNKENFLHSFFGLIKKFLENLCYPAELKWRGPFPPLSSSSALLEKLNLTKKLQQYHRKSQASHQAKWKIPHKMQDQVQHYKS